MEICQREIRQWSFAKVEDNGGSSVATLRREKVEGEWRMEERDRAGKKLYDPNTRICPTQKKSGMDTNFMFEFTFRTFEHDRIENQVGSGLANLVPSCPHLPTHSGSDQIGQPNNVRTLIFEAIIYGP